MPNKSASSISEERSYQDCPQRCWDRLLLRTLRHCRSVVMLLFVTDHSLVERLLHVHIRPLSSAVPRGREPQHICHRNSIDNTVADTVTSSRPGLLAARAVWEEGDPLLLLPERLALRVLVRHRLGVSPWPPVPCHAYAWKGGQDHLERFGNDRACDGVDGAWAFETSRVRGKSPSGRRQLH